MVPSSPLGAAHTDRILAGSIFEHDYIQLHTDTQICEQLVEHFTHEELECHADH